MNKAKKTYAKKCKSKIVTFYLKDKELYDYAKTINFQDFVKTWLRIELGVTKVLEKAREEAKTKEEEQQTREA